MAKTTPKHDAGGDNGDKTNKAREQREAGRVLVEMRREQVGQLLLRGMSYRAIARSLNLPLPTIQRDVAAIRDELLRERVTDLEACRARSIAVLRQVQVSAWKTYSDTNAKSLNKTGALNTIHQAEVTIAKLEGTLGPDAFSQQTTTVNVLAMPEWQAMRTVLLAALATHPEARMDVVEALAKMEHAVEAPKHEDGSNTVDAGD